MANKIYAVRKGRQSGLFGSWEETQPLVEKFPDAQFKSFKNLDDAKNYLNPPKIDESKLPKADVTMYTDGGCRIKNNTKGNSVGKNDTSAWAYDIHTPNAQHTGTTALKGFTNNQMELTAMIFGLQKLKDLGLNHQPTKIVSDSHYVLDPITDGRLNQWHDDQWSKNIKNKPYWQKLHQLLSDFKPQPQFSWVHGHQTSKGNNQVDKLLNESMNNLELGKRPATKAPIEKVIPNQPIKPHQNHLNNDGPDF